jgi:hypothetical protein
MTKMTSLGTYPFAVAVHAISRMMNRVNTVRGSTIDLFYLAGLDDVQKVLVGGHVNHLPVYNAKNGLGVSGGRV